MEFIRLFEYEKKINQSFDYSVFVSKQEADLFSKLYPEAKNVKVISNGVDHEYFSPQAIKAQLVTGKSGVPLRSNHHPILVFTGAMDYHANVDGVTWFCNDIFPLIRQEIPQLDFYIVGSNPHPKVMEMSGKGGVKVTGFVDDIRPYYQMADVCVVPLRIARGVQNKVLEAMSMGKPVITTTTTNQGIRATPNQHLLIADEQETFAETTVTLLSQPVLREELGANARKFVEDNYNWPTNMHKLNALLEA